MPTESQTTTVLHSLLFISLPMIDVGVNTVVVRVTVLMLTVVRVVRLR